MTDLQQSQLVAELADAADEAQLLRNTCLDEFELAQYHQQQPNRYLWRRHIASYVFAGFVGLGGTIYAIENQSPLTIPLSASAGLAVGLVSQGLDNRRQTREKDEQLQITRFQLQGAETKFREVSTQYRQEEENHWLMMALDISKEELTVLQEWMSDPRRTMKDAILESIDHLAEITSQSMTPEMASRLPVERGYRQLRQRLLAPSLQLQKDAFLGQVFAKHHYLRDQELQLQDRQSQFKVGSAAIAGGTATGLLAGTGVTLLGSGLASTLGQSKAAIASLTSVGSMAAVVGAGILAAGTLHSWLTASETERRQKEAQQFQDSFVLTTQILESMMQARGADPGKQQLHLQEAWDSLQILRSTHLKVHDRDLQDYTYWLHDGLQTYLYPNQPKPLLYSVKKLWQQVSTHF